MLEPRGHAEMYGAILVKDTELTKSGDADIGVLFCHNHGWCTMCGHATIALGRFLVDTQDADVFPRRSQLKYDQGTGTTELRLHAPCGLVRVTVPTIRGADGRMQSDPSKDVSFLSVPSFVGGTDLTIHIPEAKRWSQMKELGLQTVVVDVAYGGTFYVIVSAKALGFVGGLAGRSLQEFNEATAVLRACVFEQHRDAFVHPNEEALEFAYGVMVVDGKGEGKETGLLFFARQQVDRSPCGSCVCSRVALALEKGERDLGQPWEYHSVVSLGSSGAFYGTPVERVRVFGPRAKKEGVVVQVKGRAYYTGAHAFVHEDEDQVAGEGFIVSLPSTPTGASA